MFDCPKFDKCSAPICPLDGEWHKRSHLKGERVCFFLAEASKRGGRLPQDGPLSVEQRQTIERALPAIAQRYGAIRRRLCETSATPSRMGRRPPQRGPAPGNQDARIPAPAPDPVTHTEPPTESAGADNE